MFKDRNFLRTSSQVFSMVSALVFFDFEVATRFTALLAGGVTGLAIFFTALFTGFLAIRSTFKMI
jgi:hypothetical protein